MFYLLKVKFHTPKKQTKKKTLLMAFGQETQKGTPETCTTICTSLLIAKSALLGEKARKMGSLLRKFSCLQR